MDATRRLLCVFLAAALLAGCQIAQEKPATPSTIVSLGDSMTMGIQDAGLVAENQYNCYPYLLAKQMGQARGFQQPLVNEPGIGVPPYERPLWLEDGMVEAQYLDPGITQQQLMMLIMGRLRNLFWPEPYNNLGVNGARLDDLNHATGYATSSGGENFFYDIVLRNLDAPLPDFGDTTAVEQAIMLDPEYITLWIGNNDILGYVLGGGEKPELITHTDAVQDRARGDHHEAAGGGARRQDRRGEHPPVPAIRVRPGQRVRQRQPEDLRPRNIGADRFRPRCGGGLHRSACRARGRWNRRAPAAARRGLLLRAGYGHRPRRPG